MGWDFFKCIKPMAILIFVIAWNALWFLGVWLNDGVGGVNTLASAACFTLASAAVAVLGFSTASSGA